MSAESTWLSLLPLEVSSIGDNELTEPESEMRREDKVIGEMSITTRRLYTLGRWLEREASQNNLDARYCADKTRKKELQARANELMTKSRVVGELTWICIKDEFKLWDENIGVRSGFLVVTYPASENDMPPFLRGLLG